MQGTWFVSSSSPLYKLPSLYCYFPPVRKKRRYKYSCIGGGESGRSVCVRACVCVWNAFVLCVWICLQAWSLQVDFPLDAWRTVTFFARLAVFNETFLHFPVKQQISTSRKIFISIVKSRSLFCIEKSWKENGILCELWPLWMDCQSV